MLQMTGELECLMLLLHMTNSSIYASHHQMPSNRAFALHGDDTTFMNCNKTLTPVIMHRQDLDKSKMEIQELFGKINEIRRKAEQSEVMVQEICRDIKKLDYAKKHLTYTITALRRLAMLINAVGKLPSVVLCNTHQKPAYDYSEQSVTASTRSLTWTQHFPASLHHNFGLVVWYISTGAL